MALKRWQNWCEITEAAQLLALMACKLFRVKLEAAIDKYDRNVSEASSKSLPEYVLSVGYGF